MHTSDACGPAELVEGGVRQRATSTCDRLSNGERVRPNIVLCRATWRESSTRLHGPLVAFDAASAYSRWVAYVRPARSAEHEDVVLGSRFITVVAPVETV